MLVDVPCLHETLPNGLAMLKGSLEGENFEVKELQLAAAAAIPDDCSALVLAGPGRTMSPREDQLIADYLKEGGSGIIMVDPMAVSGLEKTSEFLGISSRHDLVLDPSRSAFPFVQLPIPEYRTHPIVDPLRAAKLDSVLQEATSLVKGTPAAGLEVHELLATSPESWGETRLSKDAKFEFDAAEDTKGPLILGYAVLFSDKQGEGNDRPGRGRRGAVKAVLFGDSDFVTNGLVRNPGNLDLFMNSINWIIGSQSAISIRAKTPEFRNLSLTPGQARFVRIFVMAVFPLLVLMAGVTIGWKRRKL